MAIQYTASTINTTFVGTTRQDIVTGISNALVSAGWTIISGTGSANVLLESATTPAPSSLVCRVTLVEPGSVSCARVQFRDVTGTKTLNTMYLLPGRTFRVIANRYQFFCFSADSVTGTYRTMASGGVPYLPSFLQGVITSMIWSQGNSRSDGDGGVKQTWRTTMDTAGDDDYYQSANQGWYVNDTVFVSETPPDQSTRSKRTLSFINVGHPLHSFATTVARWGDNSYVIHEPVITCAPFDWTADSHIVGQLWDAAILNGSFASDQALTYDSRNWWVYTNLNTGRANYSSVGSLILLTP